MLVVAKEFIVFGVGRLVRTIDILNTLVGKEAATSCTGEHFHVAALGARSIITRESCTGGGDVDQQVPISEDQSKCKENGILRNFFLFLSSLFKKITSEPNAILQRQFLF